MASMRPRDKEVSKALMSASVKAGRMARALVKCFQASSPRSRYQAASPRLLRARKSRASSLRAESEELLGSVDIGGAQQVLAAAVRFA